MSDPVLLSLIIFLPAIVALLVALFVPKDNPDAAKMLTLGVTIAVFLLTLLLVVPGGGSTFQLGVAEMQGVVAYEWIPSFNIQYLLGVDGISLPLVLLTSFLTVLAMGASWNIQKQVKAYCVLFLLLETGVLGVFLSLDFFLFYVFWEVMLLPMYFLIGIWGGPRREYAAIKFFIYTLFGGVLMLIALLMLYFNSDLRGLSQEQLAQAHVIGRTAGDDASLAKEADAIFSQPQKVHTFNILAWQQIGMNTEQFSDDGPLFLGQTVQFWAFVLLFIGFAIKVPVVPVHTWLPDAHVEAPTPISMLLAGILLKLGGYGIIRICYPVCPGAGYDLSLVVVGIGIVSMVYGAFAALAQNDFKRLVAYSSVSHMGYVILGLGVWSAFQGNHFSTEGWKLGMNGAMFQMIGHGISSAGMFFMVGVVYDRVHHRNLHEFGGLFAKMPVYSGMAIGIFFAGLGLPGLCGFIGEIFVTLSAWSYSKTLAVVAASVVILTAGYILWTVQRVYLGPEYKGPYGDHLTPMNYRERFIAAPLLAFAILLGVYPRLVFDYMTPSVNATVEQLTHWTEVNRNDPVETNNVEAAQLPHKPESLEQK